MSVFERYNGKTPDRNTCEAVARAFTRSPVRCPRTRVAREKNSTTIIGGYASGQGQVADHHHADAAAADAAGHKATMMANAAATAAAAAAGGGMLAQGREQRQSPPSPTPGSGPAPAGSSRHPRLITAEEQDRTDAGRMMLVDDDLMVVSGGEEAMTPTIAQAPAPSELGYYHTSSAAPLSTTTAATHDDAAAATATPGHHHHHRGGGAHSLYLGRPKQGRGLGLLTTQVAPETSSQSLHLDAWQKHQEEERRHEQQLQQLENHDHGVFVLSALASDHCGKAHRRWESPLRPACAWPPARTMSRL